MQLMHTKRVILVRDQQHIAARHRGKFQRLFFLESLMSRPKRMTQDEFNELCRHFRQGPKDNIDRDMFGRIVAASLKVIRHPMIEGRQLSKSGG